jgi:spermidine synthase
MFQLRVFLVAMLALLFEITSDRVLNAQLNSGFSWLCISCALLGYGVGSLALVGATGTRWENWVKKRELWLILLGINFVLFRPIFNSLALDWHAGPFSGFINYFALVLLLMGVFFFSGLYLIDVFSINLEKFSSFYFFDLLGAACGIPVSYFIIGPLNPGQLLHAAGGLSFFLGAMESSQRSWRFFGIVAFLAAIAPLFFLRPIQFGFLPHWSQKSQGPTQERLFTGWDPVYKIDVFKPVYGTRLVQYDNGDLITFIRDFDGDLARLRKDLFARLDSQFWSPGVLASHMIKENSGAKVCVIGAGGGEEIKAALMANAQSVDATEIVKMILSLDKKYDDVTGHLFSHPAVHVHQTEGRNFLRSHPENKYDIIQMFSAVTGSTFGVASPFREDLLATVDAFKEYFQHLPEDGILHINHFNFQRLLTTLARAWKEMGRTNLEDSVILIDSKDLTDMTATLLVRKKAWTPSDLEILRRLFSIPKDLEAGQRWQFVYDPLAKEKSLVAKELFSGDSDKFLSKLPYNLSPSTDDHPFFRVTFRFFPWLYDRFADDLLYTRTLHREAKKNQLIYYCGAALLLAVLILIFLLRTIVNRQKNSVFTHRFAWLYFSLIGFGFVVAEQNIVHRFLQVLGALHLAFAVGVSITLIASSVGAYFSARVRPKNLMWGLIIVYFLFLVFIDPIRAQGPVSLGLAVLPLAAALGMALPVGISQFAQAPNSFAFAWFQNGVFSAIGGYVGFIAALLFGFSFEGWLGFSVYFIAMLAFDSDQLIFRLQHIENRA